MGMHFLKPFEMTPINDVCLNNSEKHFHMISGTPYFMNVSLDCAKFQNVSVTVDHGHQLNFALLDIFVMVVASD